jgi:hypothetical protein
MPGHEADRSPLSSAEVKNKWSNTSSPLHYQCVHRHNFTIQLTKRREFQPAASPTFLNSKRSVQLLSIVLSYITDTGAWKMSTN